MSVSRMHPPAPLNFLSSTFHLSLARAFELCLEEIEKRLAVTQGGNAPDHRCVTM